MKTFEEMTYDERVERMDFITKNGWHTEKERQEFERLCDWYFEDARVFKFEFSMTEEEFPLFKVLEDQIENSFESK